MIVVLIFTSLNLNSVQMLGIEILKSSTYVMYKYIYKCWHKFGKVNNINKTDKLPCNIVQNNSPHPQSLKENKVQILFANKL